MVQFENVSLMPEDRFVNTFWFSGAWDEAGKAAIVADLATFYTTAPSGRSRSLSTWLSPVIRRVTNATRVKLYNMADAEPRAPYDSTFLATAPVVTTPLPNELAACLSFYGTRNLPRQRGRIYFGPLTSDALGTNTAGDVRLEDLFQTELKEAALRLALSTNTSWVVYSPTGQLEWPVTNGWVDNAFDIQRRRGAKASSRQVWGS